MADLFDLKGKVAIVTGAARGIGASIAEELARYGADIVVSDIILGDETVAKIKKLKRKAIFIKTDVSKKNEVENLVKETIEKFKKIDILVNNAGIFRPGATESLSEDEWDKTIDINLKGYFLCAQAAGKHMIKQRKGVIVNIASIAGLVGYAQAAAYCSTKGGIILLTKALATEWGKYGIRVNAICPGIIETAMTKGMLSNEKTKENMLTKIPAGRTGKPEDIAPAVVYLASNASSYVTGTTLVVDGGWSCGL